VRRWLRHLSPAAVRGPLVLAVLYVIPIVLWARSAPLDQRFTGQFATLTSIAVLCAFAGTSAFALNLVLGARLRPVETLFGGLDRMYRVHRINGQLAFVLLLCHFALILGTRATISVTAALDLLGPGAGWTVFAGFLAFVAMTISIVLTLFVRLGHEVFVYVQRSFGLIFLTACYTFSPRTARRRRRRRSTGTWSRSPHSVSRRSRTGPCSATCSSGGTRTGSPRPTVSTSSSPRS
jgi:predicted ferric reductase